MMRSRLTIMNMALSASGQPGKEVTEASTGPEYALMDRWYAEIVASVFEDGDFHFGKRRYTLTTRSAGDFGFDDAWLLPSDVLHIIEVYVSGYATEDWERNGDYLYIDAESGVAIEYIVAGQEDKWTAKAAIAVATALEALLRRSVNEEYEEARDTEQRANFLAQIAGTHSSKQRGRRRGFQKGFLLRSRTRGPQRFRRRGDT